MKLHHLQDAFLEWFLCNTLEIAFEDSLLVKVEVSDKALGYHVTSMGTPQVVGCCLYK